MERERPFSGAAMQLVEPRGSEKFSTALRRCVPQQLFENTTVDVPAVPVRVAKEVGLDGNFRSPCSPIAVTGEMALPLEGIEQTHIAEEAPGGGGERLTDGGRGIRSCIRDHDPPRPRQIQSRR